MTSGGSETAGFRNAQWSMGGLPEGTSATAVALQTHDLAACTGFLFWRGAPDTAVCIMHPREFLATHYLIPSIVESGCAAWAQTPRSVGNDLRLEHELALLDVAAGVAFLRRQGFKRIVLLGNSGGASLYTFYNQQALMAPEARLPRTPGGRPTNLPDAEMPAPDALIYVAPHPGQGKLLLRSVDPSVTDENDPFATDPSLDPFDPANGFAPAPQGARYASEFVARYRVAQEARVARLDGIARRMIETRLGARKKAKETGERASQIRGSFTPAMTIWRTDADLRCWDVSLDPSDRRIGSVWGADPMASNYGAVGFARFCTPEAWLSTWSGFSSKAAMSITLKSAQQPVLWIEYTGDNTIFPADLDAMYAAIPTADKQRHKVRGDHHGRALAKGEAPGRIQAGQAIAGWLRQRFSA